MRRLQPPAPWVVEAFEGRVPTYVDEVTELRHGRPVGWWSTNPRTGAPSGWPKGQAKAPPAEATP